MWVISIVHFTLQNNLSNISLNDIRVISIVHFTLQNNLSNVSLKICGLSQSLISHSVILIFVSQQILWSIMIEINKSKRGTDLLHLL